MTKVIFWKTEDDKLMFINVQYPVTLERAVASIPTNTPYGIMDSKDLPSRDFRDSWDCDGEDLTYNV